MRCWRAQDPGARRHRRGGRRRAVSLGHQPRRNQRHDRLLRPAAERRLTRSDARATRSTGEVSRGSSFGRRRPGSSPARSAPGGSNLARDYQLFRDLTPTAQEVHRHQPLHAGQGAGRRALRASLEQLVLALADVLQRPGSRRSTPTVVQVDEANVTGHPEDGPIAAAGINRVLAGRASARRPSISASATTAGRRSRRARTNGCWLSSTLLQADHVVLEIARRPEHELEVLRERAAGDWPGDRRDRHQGQRGRDA